MSDRDFGARALPIAATIDGRDSIHAFAWRQRGVLSITVVVKTARSVAPDGRLAAIAAEPPNLWDRHYQDSSQRPLREPSDVVPFRDQVDVLVSAPAAQRPFARVALARGGAAFFDKSVTLSAKLEGAGFSAIPAGASERLALLGGRETPGFARGVLELPPDLDRRFFQSAPGDQRVAELRPGDQILVQGLHPRAERVVFSLPSEPPKVVAKLAQASHTVQMRCDQLLVDAVEGRVVLSWRGSFTMPNEEALGRVLIHATSDTSVRPQSQASPTGTMALDADGAPDPSAQPDWMGRAPTGNTMSAALLRKMQKGAPQAPTHPSAPHPPAAGVAGTMLVEAEGGAPLTLPFERQAGGQRSSNPDLSGFAATPWARDAPKAAPKAIPVTDDVQGTLAIDVEEPPPPEDAHEPAPTDEAQAAAPIPPAPRSGPGSPWREEPASPVEPQAPAAPPRVRPDVKAALRKKFAR
ncbi:MAG: DUF2169 domain-containing protein [Polyangiaceae bacterium]